MGRFSWAASGIAISMLMGGCSLFGGGEPEVSSPIAESPPRPSPQPLATPKPKSNPILIKPTNPEQRLRELKSGRVDPFRALVSIPAAGSSSGSTATNTSADPGTTAAKAYTRFLDKVGDQFDQALNPPTSSTTGSLPNPVFGKPPTSTSGGSNGSGGSSSKFRLPTLPQPDLAKGVQVTGIISVAGVPRAIVKAPGEAVSRSVTTGERLANGQVLVKRIDMNGSEPVVILEQYGTEVAIEVGGESS